MSNAAVATAITAAGAAVEAAVRRAAQRTGVDFGYLIAQARIESGLNPQAQSRSSSAAGLYQFTTATWLETVARHGAAHGLGWAAEALRNGAAALGTETRAAILALRNDAEAAAAMAAEYAADNRDALERQLGRAVGATDLYMAHFLGRGGAARFLAAAERDASAPAAAVAPGAARANRSIFYAADGRARSVGEVLARFAGKLGAPVATGNAVPASGTQLPAPLTTRALNQRQLAALDALAAAQRG